MFFYHDFDTYVIPGMDLVTLGGTRQLDSWNENVDPNDAKGIWDRCTGLVPSLAGATVVKQWVGLRPHRSEVRCEVEELAVPGGGGKTLKVNSSTTK
jgi:glycine/D-amino acid oxidase-like deaminating enzyme